MTLSTKQLNQLIYSSSLPWYIQDRLVSKTRRLWIESNLLPFKEQVKEIPAWWIHLKNGVDHMDVRFEEPRNSYLKDNREWAHIDSPIENYPLNIDRMWNEELRSHCREATGKKRLKKSLSRSELINMILKA